MADLVKLYHKDAKVPIEVPRSLVDDMSASGWLPKDDKPVTAKKEK